MSQPNNLPALQFSSGPANLSAEVMASMAAMYDESFSGLGGLGLRRIRVGKVGFILQDGQNKETVAFDQLFGVFVGSGPTNHAVWWTKDFVPGQEPEEPDLCWYMPTPDTYPDALPQQFRSKINKNGREVWAFQILRRVAFVLMRNINGQFFLDVEKPYIMDLSSMSLFGKGMPEQNMYKWSGIRDMCSQNSTTQIRVMPSMFITKIVVDVNAPSGVVMFMPMRDQQSGQLQFLDPSLVLSVHDCAQKQSTRDMLKIREKLTLNGEAPAQFVQTATTTPPQQSAPVSYPQQVAPVQSLVVPGNFVTPTTPVQPVQQYPTTPVQAPVQVSTPAGADMSTLLQQAQQILNQGAPVPVQQPAAPVQAPVAPIQMPQPIPQVQPVTPPTVDASVQSSIDNLMAQLGG